MAARGRAQSAAARAATSARKEEGSLSDIGAFYLPNDLAIVLILGWPALLAGVVVGAPIGWLIGRKRRPWLGLAAGVVAGLVVGAAGFLAYIDGWIGS